MCSWGHAPDSRDSVSSERSPLPHEAATRVLNTINDISAASDDINQRIERGISCLLPTTATTMLCRVSTLSESLREEVMSLPLSTIPSLHIVHKPLLIYGPILVDIQHILSSNDPVEISNDTTLAIDRRLDDFLFQFQEALDRLNVPTGQRSSPNSTHFFQNSHHITISGGNFTSNTFNNPVVHDPVVQKQCHKILQVVYIQCIVLFS